MNNKEWIKTSDPIKDLKTGQIIFPATYRQKTAKEKLVESAKELGIELDDATIALGTTILSNRDLSRAFLGKLKK